MHRTLKIPVVVALFFIVASCAGSISRSELVTWEKPGVSPEGMRAEFGLCGGNFDSVGQPKFHPTEFDALNKCMTRKGFKLVTL